MLSQWNVRGFGDLILEDESLRQKDRQLNSQKEIEEATNTRAKS